jgi:hypothetical protein
MIFVNPKYSVDQQTNQTLGITATIEGIDYIIPLDPANRHYAEIMRQVDAGELTIQDAD